MTRQIEAETTFDVIDGETRELMSANVMAVAPSDSRRQPYDDQPMLVIDTDDSSIQLPVFNIMKLLQAAGFHVHTNQSAQDCACR